MREQYQTFFRFIIIALMLGITTYQFGEHLLKMIFPLYEWLIKQFDYRFNTATLTILTKHGEQFLLLETKLFQSFYVGIEFIETKIPIKNSATMPLGNVLLPIVLIFTFVFSWPIKISHKILQTYSIRVLLAIPLCLLMMLLDMPTQLVKMVWETLNKLLNLNFNSMLPYFTYWTDFLNGGGLMALSIAIGILIIGITDYLIEPNFD